MWWHNLQLYYSYRGILPRNLRDPASTRWKVKTNSEKLSIHTQSLILKNKTKQACNLNRWCLQPGGRHGRVIFKGSSPSTIPWSLWSCWKPSLQSSFALKWRSYSCYCHYSPCCWCCWILRKKTDWQSSSESHALVLNLLKEQAQQVKAASPFLLYCSA